MGLFDDLVNQVTADAGGTPSHASMADAVLGMLNSPGSGGAQGLAEAFGSQGLGDIMSSWIGTGANQPVAPDQVHSALGADKILELAKQVGVSPQMASSLLSVVLPLIIDKLTPGGRMPAQGGLLSQGLGMLTRTLQPGRTGQGEFDA